MKINWDKVFRCQILDKRFITAQWVPFDFKVNSIVKQYSGSRYAPEFGKGVWLLPAECLLAIANEVKELNYNVIIENLQVKATPLYNSKLNEQIYPYQREAVIRALDERRIILSFETGLGKTATAIESLRMDEVCHFLVVCPAMLRQHWKNEIDKWYPNAEVTTVLPGKKQQLGFNNIIVSYDQMDKVKDMKFDGIIFDEAHFVMNGSAKRSKTAKTLVNNSLKDALIICLTATPITNEPHTIYNQLDLLWPERFGKYWGFCYRYCNIIENQYGKQPKGLNEDHAEELYNRLAAVSVRVTKEEVKHLLPPMIVETHYVEAHEDKIGIAAGLVKQYGESCSHVMALAYHYNEAEKLQAAITTGTDRPVYYLTGEVENQKRIKELDKIKTGKAAFTVGTMKALNVGIDLTFNQVAVISELYTAPAVLTQLLGRFSRLGGSGTTKVIILVTKGSEDEQKARKLIRRIEDIGTAYKNSVSENNLSNALKPDETNLLNDLLSNLGKWETDEGENKNDNT